GQPVADSLAEDGADVEVTVVVHEQARLAVETGNRALAAVEHSEEHVVIETARARAVVLRANAPQEGLDPLVLFWRRLDAGVAVEVLDAFDGEGATEDDVDAESLRVFQDVLGILHVVVRERARQHQIEWRAAPELDQRACRGIETFPRA